MDVNTMCKNLYLHYDAKVLDKTKFNIKQLVRKIVCNTDKKNILINLVKNYFSPHIPNFKNMYGSYIFLKYTYLEKTVYIFSDSSDNKNHCQKSSYGILTPSIFQYLNSLFNTTNCFIYFYTNMLDINFDDNRYIKKIKNKIRDDGYPLVSCNIINNDPIDLVDDDGISLCRKIRDSEFEEFRNHMVEQYCNKLSKKCSKLTSILEQHKDNWSTIQKESKIIIDKDNPDFDDSTQNIFNFLANLYFVITTYEKIADIFNEQNNDNQPKNISNVIYYINDVMVEDYQVILKDLGFTQVENVIQPDKNNCLYMEMINQPLFQ